jgi:hypothetical protein
VASGEWTSIRYSLFAFHETNGETKRRWWCPCPFASQAKKKKSEAERRQTQWVFAGPAGPAAPGSPGAHLSAFHRGSGLGDRTPLPGFSSALPGMRPPSGFPLSLPVSAQRCFSQTGHSAGRANNPKPPGSGLQVRRGHRPRPAPWPAGQSASDSRTRCRLHVTEMGTNVNRSVTLYFMSTSVDFPSPLEGEG